jgi:hypothetical protein
MATAGGSRPGGGIGGSFEPDDALAGKMAELARERIEADSGRLEVFARIERMFGRH